MTRPQLDIPYSGFQWALAVLGTGLLLAQWILAIAWYPSLPDTIPIHFNARGEADVFGSRATIFMMPIPSVFLGALLLWLSRMPHLYNYPGQVTEANARSLYAGGMTYMLATHLWVQLIFSMALFEMNPQPAWSAWPFHWAVMALVGIILIQTVVWLVAASKKA